MFAHQGALRNGVTVPELKELFLHSAIYCGLPAANAACHRAEELLRELNAANDEQGTANVISYGGGVEGSAISGNSASFSVG